MVCCDDFRRSSDILVVINARLFVFCFAVYGDTCFTPSQQLIRLAGFDRLRCDTMVSRTRDTSGFDQLLKRGGHMVGRVHPGGDASREAVVPRHRDHESAWEDYRGDWSTHNKGC